MVSAGTCGDCEKMRLIRRRKCFERHMGNCVPVPTGLGAFAFEFSEEKKRQARGLRCGEVR